MIVDASPDATTVGVIADTSPDATTVGVIADAARGSIPGPIRGLPVTRAPMRPRA
ncbi:MAG: hypothetical protein QOJ44_2094 [Acidimicrobiaceae bacterium]|nr:hypothetical protein [Acidimicrobiaceae bacterium]